MKGEEEEEDLGEGWKKEGGKKGKRERERERERERDK